MLTTREVNIQRWGNARNPDIVFYNAEVIDGKEIDEGVGSNPPATYNEMRDSVLINDSSKYYFSVVRAQINGGGLTLPVIIPQIVSNQSNPNLTIYKIGMTLAVDYVIGGVPKTNTFDASSNIIFQPQSTTIPVPPPPIGGTTQDLFSEYYYVYDYQHFVDMVNTAFQVIFADFNNQFGLWFISEGGSSPAPKLLTTAPYMYYNPDTKRFELYTDRYGFGGADRTSAGSGADESFKLWFNSNLFGLFSSFPNEYEGGDLAINNQENLDGYSYEILITNKLGKNVYTDSLTPPPSKTYWITDQQWSSTGIMWSPVASISFVSYLLPVIPENTAPPVAIGQGNSVVPFTGQSAFVPLITDVVLPIDSADQYRGLITYVPSAEFRLSTMIDSPTEIRNLDFSIFWKNRLDGNLYPLRLYNKSSISIKCMFRRRDFNLTYTDEL